MPLRPLLPLIVESRCEPKPMPPDGARRARSFEARKAQPLFRAAVETRFFSHYDVTLDGKRFVINAVSNTNTPLTLVVNWTARLGDKP